MPPIICRGFSCLTFLLASALCIAAGPPMVPSAGGPPMASSLDQFIANAKRQAETGSTEFKQLVAQLDPLKAKQQALLATRRAKEAELARVRSTGGDTEQIAALQQEIDACRSQLKAVDTQFQVLISRIQPGPNSSRPIPVMGSGPPMPLATATRTQGPVPLPATPIQSGSNPSRPILSPGVSQPSFVPTPALLTRTVPPDKIKAAADALARSPAPSAAAARTAATQILSASQPGSTNVEVEQLAQLIVQLAAQANEAELHAELKAQQQADEKKSDSRVSNQASQEIKFEIRIPSSGDHPNHLQELRARQAKLQQASIELLKKSTAGSGPISPVKK